MSTPSNPFDDLYQKPVIARGMTGVVQALAGCTPADPDSHLSHEDRETLKFCATEMRIHLKKRGEIAPHILVPWWLLHAYSHWARAFEALQHWDDADFEDVFPDGLRFKDYLSHWLHAVGVPQLGMTQADLRAMHKTTRVASFAHDHLPVGHSYYWLRAVHA